MKLTDRRKKAFLKELELHGIQTRAARAASPRASSRYGAIQTLKDERERDPEFAWQWDEQFDAPPVRDRSNETGATLKASSISLLEICAALKIARDDNAGAADDDLIRAAARLLGFKRVGSDLKARISEALITLEA